MVGLRGLLLLPHIAPCIADVLRTTRSMAPVRTARTWATENPLIRLCRFQAGGRPSDHPLLPRKERVELLLNQLYVVLHVFDILIHLPLRRHSHTKQPVSTAERTEAGGGAPTVAARRGDAGSVRGWLLTILRIGSDCW